MTLKYDKKRARSVLGTGRPHSFSPFGQANHEPANLEYGPRFLDIPPSTSTRNYSVLQSLRHSLIDSEAATATT